MKVIFVVLLSVGLISAGDISNRSYKNIYGTYRDKKYNHRLRINCDNTANCWLWNDKNEPISGRVSFSKDTMILKVNLSEFDSLHSAKWNGVIKFLMGKNQLTRVINVYDWEFEHKINSILKEDPFLRIEKMKCENN